MVHTNILHVTLCLEIGGLETIIVELCKRLVASGKYNVQILCLNRYDNEYKKHLEEYGIQVHLLHKKGGKDFRFFFQFINFLKNNNIDIVHAHSGCLFDSALCSHFARTKGILFTAHGMPLQNGFKTWAEDQVATRLIDKYIAVSEEIDNFSRKRFPSQGQKIGKIINGVNTEVFQPNDSQAYLSQVKDKFNIPKDRIVIGSVGRLETIKNYSCLIRAFAKVINVTQKPLQLVLVGEGDEKEKLEEITREEFIQNNVSFLGMQYSIHNILPIFDIFVLPSFTEGTSVSLLEAQACGVPGVVTNVGGNPNIITHGINGFLCNVDDATDLAKHINLIVERADLKRKMGKQARENVLKNFSLASMVKQYKKIYADLNNKGCNS